MRGAFAVLTFGALAVSSPLVAQMSAGTRSVGMGGGGMVFASGVDAVEWNPANLARGGGWNVSIYELGLAGLGDGATLKEIRTVLGDDGTGLDPTTVVAGLPDAGLRLSSVSEGFITAIGADQLGIPKPGSPLPTVGIAVGPVAFRIRSRVFSDVVLSKELADLLGNGFEEENIQNYAVGNTGWRTASLTEYTLAYGARLGGVFSIGVGGRYVQGQGLVDGRFFEPQISITDATFTMQTVAVESGSGSGFGLDLGLSLDLPLGFQVGASGTNVLQRMTWDDALVAHSATFSEVDFDDELSPDFDFEDFVDRFQDSPVDPTSVSLPVFEAGGSLFEGAFFPQIYRGGVGWQSGGTTLEATGVVVSPRGRFSSPWDERIAVGFEQRIPVLTVRLGYGIARESLSTVSGGIGLRFGPVELEGSVGKFNGTPEVGAWDGYYGTVGLQLRGGGR